MVCGARHKSWVRKSVPRVFDLCVCEREEQNQLTTHTGSVLVISLRLRITVLSGTCRSFTEVPDPRLRSQGGERGIDHGVLMTLKPDSSTDFCIPWLELFTRRPIRIKK